MPAPITIDISSLDLLLGNPSARGRLIFQPLDATQPTVAWEVDSMREWLQNTLSIDKARVGLALADNTPDASKPVSSPQAAALALKASEASLIAHIDTANAHGVTPAVLGLGSVNNTADANKPVSGPQAAALAAKLDKIATVSGGTPAIDFTSDSGVVRRIDLSGAGSFTGTGYGAGRSQELVIVAGAASRSLSFPAGWRFLGAARPTELAANKVAKLSLFCYGDDATSVIAGYAAEA